MLFRSLPATYTVSAPRVDPYRTPDAQTVTTTAGTTTRADFTYQFQGTFHGTVTGGGTTPLVGVRVCDDHGDCATTDTAGYYSFHTPTGSISVVPQRFVQGYAVHDALGPYAQDATSDIQVDIDYTPNVSITGFVRDEIGRASCRERVYSSV